MLRLPLRKQILLITTSGMFICKVICAKEEYIIAVDVEMRMISPTNDIFYTAHELGGKVHFDGTAITGYSNLEEDCEFTSENEYRKKIVSVCSNNSAELNRKNFLVIENK